MSRSLGREVLHLRPTTRPGHTEYSLEYHDSLMRELLGDVPRQGVSREASDYALWDAAQRRRLYDAWDFDFLWHTNDGLIDWSRAGRVTEMGHAVYATDGSDLRPPTACPFTDPEEVWSFDPTREYGLPDFHEQRRVYQEQADQMRSDFPNQLSGGGYYRTVISGAIAAFGWEMLLLAAAEPERFAAVLRRFGEHTRFFVEAWAETDIELFIQHDDMVWTAGPFLHPDFYRQVLFPIYRQLWEPLRARGKKVIFCSDGTYDLFMEDILASGADGLIFEPSNPYASVVGRFGGRCCLFGSAVDCRTLAFQPWESVRREMDETWAVARGVPGLVLAVGNHLPANVTDETCHRYLEAWRDRWSGAVPR